MSSASAAKFLLAAKEIAAVSRLVQMLKEPVVSQQYVEEEDAAILRRAVVDALKSTGDLSALPVLESVASSRNEYQSVREMAQIAAEALSKEEK